METLQLNTGSKLSSLQMELLRIYSFNPSENELSEIKKILGKFFSNKLSILINKAVEKN